MKMFQRLRLGRWMMPLKGQQRNFTTTLMRRGGDHHDEGGIPGSNLPFSINNRWKLALYMGVYMGSGFATPFLLLRHQLLKKQ